MAKREEVLTLTRRATGGGLPLPPLLQESAPKPASRTLKPRICVTVPPAVLEEFDRFCEENSRSRSFTVSIAMQAFLNGAELVHKLDRDRGREVSR